MPLSLPTRRDLLRSAAALLTLPALPALAALKPVDEHLIAILNDTHIGEKQKPGVGMPGNLAATVQDLVDLPRRPAAVVINGDLALRDGQPGDYRLFAQLVQPLRDAGIAVHLTMGNHDDRDVFYSVLKEQMPVQPVVRDRHLAVVKTRSANLFLLDSLLGVMVAQGDLGEKQLHWLARSLDAHADKPALVFAHHNPRLGGDPLHFPGGLVDSGELWAVLEPRKHVKAYVHGHIHHRDFFEHRGVHILNTPATGYVANKNTSTTGWTMARLTPTGGQFTTRTHLPDHPWNNVVTELKWR